jgi:histone deacetylase 1/2
MLVLGGGGYTMRNVARCWAYETGRLLGRDLPDEIPEEAYAEYDYYMDTHRLRIQVSNMENTNTRPELEKLRSTVLEQLSRLPAAPGAMLAARPPRAEAEEAPEEEMDVRGGGQAAADRRTEKEGDYEETGEARAGARADAEAAAPAPPAPAGEAPAPPVKAEGGGGGAAPGGGADATFLAAATAAAAAPAGASPADEDEAGGGGAAPMDADGAA